MSDKEGSSERDVVAMDLDDGEDYNDGEEEMDGAISGPSRKRQCNGQSSLRNSRKDNASLDGMEVSMSANGRKRMTKNDSGISVEDRAVECSADDRQQIQKEVDKQDFARPGEVAKEILRLKVSIAGNGDMVDSIDIEKSSPADSGNPDDYDQDSGHDETAMASSSYERTKTTEDGPRRLSDGHSMTDAEDGAGSSSDGPNLSEDKSVKSDHLSLSSSNDDDGEDDDGSTPRYSVKTKPKHNWFLCPEVLRRQYGISNNVSNDLFRLRAYGSLHMVERLELMYMMKRHKGCVNTLHFNNTGTRLASGSDDLNVIIWDWAIGEPLLVFDSGHRSNVFQAKFMPLGGDSVIVTCARDGQVRLAELSSTNVCKGTRGVAYHKGAAHKLALEPDCPHTFLSCGEDGVVFEIDLRESKAEKLLTCKENNRKVPLYTIYAHPTNSNEFAVGGKDHFVRIYDKRQISQSAAVLKKYCPHHLNSDVLASVTCLVYNHNGSELLASYNDEDIYTFDTDHSDGADFIHRYQGHRNSCTVKGVNYFGPNSEFVVSGSDCGNIYVWEHGTESVVQFMAGDEGGVVNCLEPHPHIPVLATSGLDDSVKIWVPSCENAPKLGNLKSVTRSNRREREEDRRREPETIDGQMLWFLMHHLRRSARRRARQEGEQVEDDSPSDPEEMNSDDDDDDDEDGDGNNFPQSGVQCTTA